MAEAGSILARTVDPQHPHVASRLVASSVGINDVVRAPAARAEALAHAGVPAWWPTARVVAQALDRAQDRIELGPGGRPGIGSASFERC